MQRLPGRWPPSPSRRTFTLTLVLGLLGAFAYATYLSYWAHVDISSAFAYQSAVVAAERDSELLEVEQYDRRSSQPSLRRYEKLLASDLQRIETIAGSASERPPAFGFPATRARYEQLTSRLAALETVGRRRFEATSLANTHTRDLSNLLFSCIALLFVLLSSRFRAAMERGRSLVERLQRAFVSKDRAIPNLDVGSVLLSATRGSSVGGDVYDAFTYDDRTAMFFVADVSGKGIEAAVDTALIKYALRTLFATERDPGEMLRRFADIYEKSAQNPESFVVLFLATVDLETGLLDYASAGHEPAWSVQSGSVTRLAPTGPVLGVVPNAAYETRRLCLSPGDAVVVTTDGVTESRNARGTLLGAETVTDWLTTIVGDAQSVADHLVRRIRRRSSGITDDVAILVVRFAPRADARSGGVVERAETVA